MRNLSPPLQPGCCPQRPKGESEPPYPLYEELLSPESHWRPGGNREFPSSSEVGLTSPASEASEEAYQNTGLNKTEDLIKQ